MKLGANIVHLAYICIGIALYGGITWFGGRLYMNVNELLGGLFILLGWAFGVGVMQKIGNALNSVLAPEARLWRER